MSRAFKNTAISALGLVLVASASCPVFAQKATQSAADLEILGVRLASEQKDYSAALKLFMQSLALEDRISVRCNIGNAHYSLEQFPQAHLYLSQCLAGSATQSDANYIAEMGKLLRETEQELQKGNYEKIRVSIEPKSARASFDIFPNDYFQGTQSFWLPTGAHRLQVSAKGYTTFSQEIVLIKESPKELQVRLEKKSTATLPPKALPSQNSSKGREERAVEPPKTSNSHTRSIVAGSIGLALGIGGGLVSYWTEQKRKDAALLPTSDPKHGDLKTTIERNQYIYTGMWIGAAAAGVFTAYFFFVDREESKSESALSLQLSPEGALVHSRWTF